MNYIGKLVKFKANTDGNSRFYHARTIRLMQEQLENNRRIGKLDLLLYNDKQNDPILVLHQYWSKRNNEEAIKVLLPPNNFIFDLPLEFFELYK